jgi:DNA-directed RNA polymerase III subunit RPC3
LIWPKSDCIQRIFTILLRRGRLSIHTLAQHTRLNRRQLRLGLIVLIQQNLIYYVEEGPQATYYEANRGAAYGLVRSGKILGIVESRYGSVARDLVLNLFLLGHAKVGELIDLFQLNRSTTVNGDSGAHTASHAQRHTPGQLDSILCDLLEAGLLEPVTDLSFRSPDDTFNEVEQNLLKAEFTGGTKGTKQKELLKTRIRDELASLRSERQKWKSKGNKRKLEGVQVNGTNGNAKRRRFSNGSLAVNGNHADEDESLRLEVGCSSCTAGSVRMLTVH